MAREKLSEAERMKRIRKILANVRRELRVKPGDTALAYEVLGRSLAQYGAMLVDTAEGVDYVGSGETRSHKLDASDKRSTSYKVRKALGYTYP